MPEKWTREQLEAISARNSNLLISAAAGSGKTAVLVERILSIVTDKDKPVDIDRLLVVTFTKAAAAEMKGRLREKLALTNAAGIDGVVRERQLALLPQARISTFDSLCQTIVRENFTELGIDPSFTVGDDDELFVLREQALDEVFEQSYESTEFRALVEAVCERADDFELRQTVLEVYEFIQSVREPEKWLSEMTEKYNITAGRVSETPFGTAAFARVKNELRYAADLLKKSVEHAPTEYFGELNENIQAVLNTLGAESYEEMSGLLRALVFKNLPPARNADEESRSAAQRYRGEAKDIVGGVKEKYFLKAPAGVLEDIKASYPVIKALCETVLRFSQRYMELKSEKRILGFTDIKLLCFRVLVKDGRYTAAAEAYRQLYEYVMVDEYQDTNDVEEGILDALSRRGADGNRFMVGDVKQSIYRFRQAKPELFIEKSELYSDVDENSRLITLNENFRSRKFILDSINFIFSQIMKRDSAEIEYDANAALKAGASYGESDFRAVKIALIETDEAPETGESADDGVSINELKALEVEALHIASQIHELVCECKPLVKDGDTERPVKFSDVVILMRSGKKNGALVSDILTAKAIPSYTEGKTGWFELNEISDILALLQIIDNPLQEIPLLTVLTSPVYKFTPDELIQIRKADGKGWFYSALSAYAKKGENAALIGKVSAFLEKLEQYRTLASGMTTTELLTFLYDDTGYFVIAGAMENGRLRQANLRSLLKRAADYEKTTFTGLFHFVRYMERLKARDALAAPDTARDEDAVRIMTIHKSKGLEFPVVFLAGCGSRFNLRDLSEKFILHQEHGFGASFVDAAKRIKTPTLPRNVIKEILRGEALAEEMRLLYVAMTRAKEMLYISGSAGANAGKKLEKWHGAATTGGECFPPEVITGARSYMDWLMPAVLRSRGALPLLSSFGLSFLRIPNEYANSAAFEPTLVKRSETAPATETDEAGGRLAAEAFREKLSGIIESGEALREQIAIDKTMNWKYNYEANPVKLTVSEIKTRWQKIISGDVEALSFDEIGTKAELAKPLFMLEERGLTPAEKGTAVHTVLANVDFAKTRSQSDVLAVMDGLLERRLLNEKEYAAVNVSDVAAFLESDFADRIRCADNVRREVPFVIAVSAEEAYLPPSDETVLVHGIIDCFFEENGGVVVVDYKTDYVNDNDFEAVKRKYKIQLDIYREAAAKITQKPVLGVYLYMLRYGRLIEC